MKIEFGGSSRVSDGYVSCDLRESGSSLPAEVKYICPCWDIGKHVEPNTVDAIYSRHMFEHLTFKQGMVSLEAWFKILKPGGRVDMILPDLHFHIKEYLEFYNERPSSYKWGKRDGPTFLHAIAGLFGWQREGGPERFTAFEKDWDVHKSGYDEISLKQAVEKARFVKFTRNSTQWKWDLDTTFYKP